LIRGTDVHPHIPLLSESGAMRRTVAADSVYALPPRYHSLSGTSQRLVKRSIDVMGAGIGMVLFAPLYGVIALLIIMDSGLPVLFRWNVVGVRGKYLTSYKFRTMVPGAEARQGELSKENEMSGPVFKMRRDPRVTRIGRVLRRYSLDELPQLWSVFKGDMSLVGPRPLRQHEFEVLTPVQRARFAVTPGLTCLWQVSGRSDIRSFDEWMRLDRQYIESWSLWLDLYILLRTVPVVARGRGAY
jgi:lipopolysaccharide/colanic/teichoic acid biosynthesis glycosyltransferase